MKSLKQTLLEAKNDIVYVVIEIGNVAYVLTSTEDEHMKVAKALNVLDKDNVNYRVTRFRSEASLNNTLRKIKDVKRFDSVDKLMSSII